MDWNKKAKEIYEQNKAAGWWDNPNRCMMECLQLAITEVSEATEAERKDLFDDKLPHRKGGEVELADAAIRLLDVAGAKGWRYSPHAIPNRSVVDLMGLTVGARHFLISDEICQIGYCLKNHGNEFRNFEYSRALNLILMVCESLDYDLIGAIDEKLEYNKHRADHKRENRAKKGGKKF